MATLRRALIVLALVLFGLLCYTHGRMSVPDGRSEYHPPLPGFPASPPASGPFASSP